MGEIHELMKANEKFQVEIQNLSLTLTRLSTETKGIQELNRKIHTEVDLYRFSWKKRLRKLWICSDRNCLVPLKNR